MVRASDQHSALSSGWTSEISFHSRKPLVLMQVHVMHSREDRQGDGHRQTGREMDTDRQTDRQGERQVRTDKNPYRDGETDRERKAGRQTLTDTDRQAGRQADICAPPPVRLWSPQNGSRGLQLIDSVRHL